MNRTDLTNAVWRTSSLSNDRANCVEIAFLDDGSVGLRDSKDRGQGPVLLFTPAEWDAFVGGAKDGEFDQP